MNMRKFIKKAIVFIVVILSFSLLFDLIVSIGLKKTERGHFYTFNKLMNDTLNNDILIMGNSRAACSYSPQIIDTILHVDSRNIGVSGQPFGISHLRYKIYQRKNINPKMIILNIDYCELKMFNNGYEREQYYPYVLDKDIKKILKANSFSWFDVYCPMYRYRGNYKLIGIGLSELFGIFHDTKGDYYKGYSSSSETYDGKKLQNMLSDNKKIESKFDIEAVDLFKQFCEEITEDSIQLVFCYAPLYKKLYENLDQDSIMQIYNEMSEKYSIPLLDYTTDPMCSDTSFFKDSNHLNKKGSELFTIKLCHDIDSLQLLN